MPKKMKQIVTFISNSIRADKEVTSYISTRNKLRPYEASIKVAIIYGVLGSLWILFSSEVLSLLDLSEKATKTYELYKGWFYVLMTTLLIFYLVLRNLLLFEEALKKLWHNYDDLNEAHVELLAVKEDLSYMAYTDLLTNLPNKRAFEVKMKNFIEHQPEQKLTLVYMDIDNFKNINDSLGHDVGDELLIDISNTLKKVIQEPDLVFRVGGDEFIILYPGVSTHKEMDEKMVYLLKHIRKQWKVNNQEFFSTFSMGITLYPEDGNTVNILLRNADATMYSVKKGNKDSYAFYCEELQAKNIKQIEMVNELRNAIVNEEFILQYQPIRHLKRESMEGVEALIRWIHPTKGLVPPMEFIPLAEETGLIYEIDKWVLKTALLQKKEWEDKGLSHIKMSINISGKGLIQDGLVQEIRAILVQTQLTSSEIQIEVTETALMEDIEASAKVLEELRGLGIKIALDDFGTGYSSLTYLEKLPIDVVKLDRQFIRDMMNLDQVNVIVKTVIQLTHDLVLEIVAEGIETENQLDYLMLHDCDYGQGYLFSRPVSIEEIEKNL